MMSGVVEDEVSLITGKRCSQEVVERGQGLLGLQERGKFRGYVRVGLRVLRDRSGSWR